MGSYSFLNTVQGTDLNSAFQAAHSEALYEHGHRGYTGTIAEKQDCELRSALIFTHEEANAFIYGSPQCGTPPDIEENFKWGPAFAIKIADDPQTRKHSGFIFYGYASS